MITEAINKITSEAKEGVKNPLEAYIILKGLEIEVKQAISELQNLAINEASKYPEKRFNAFGAMIERKSSPAQFDFKHIKTITDLEERVKGLKEKAKIGTFVDEETGEMIDKAYKIEGKETIAIKFEKE